MSIPTTTRVNWAEGLFETEEAFVQAFINGDAPGLELVYDENGDPYLDEGECQGPFAGEEE